MVHFVLMSKYNTLHLQCNVNLGNSFQAVHNLFTSSSTDRQNQLFKTGFRFSVVVRRVSRVLLTLRTDENPSRFMNYEGQSLGELEI